MTDKRANNSNNPTSNINTGNRNEQQQVTQPLMVSVKQTSIPSVSSPSSPPPPPPPPPPPSMKSVRNNSMHSSSSIDVGNNSSTGGTTASITTTTTTGTTTSDDGSITSSQNRQPITNVNILSSIGSGSGSGGSFSSTAINTGVGFTAGGGVNKKRLKPGILRLDISKPRRSSGGSVEFRPQPELIREASALPSALSPPQLSVTWASNCDVSEPDPNKTKQMQSLLKHPHERGGKRSSEDRSNELSPELTSPTNASDEPNSDEGEEDYSMSVNAIMQRRASIRGGRRKSHRGSRRTSSPMDHVFETGGHLGDRRRSSVYTTSSGDTAISLDDGTNQDSTQEQIFENIRLHKEVIQSVKYQPWSMRRKLKLVRQAKTYIARHEGALQERFSKSRSTKDLWARFKILMAARWKHWKREMASFFTILIPWELRIKEIESHFGSGVASYFTFLRWLLWVNIMIAIPLLAFVIIPESLATDLTIEDNRKQPTPGELKIAGNIVTIWEFEGYLKYSPIFYGFYSNYSGAIRWGYNLPLAYFLTSVAVYIYSFVATLRKMAENSRLSKLSSKDDECIFSWKLFTGWDFMIGHAETAHNRIASVVVGFKEALLEEAEKKKDNRNWRIILQRILVNIVVTALLAASGYTVYIAVDRQEDALPNDTWFRRNEVNIIMTLLSFFLPMMFDALGLFENWHPRQQLRLQLARIMILNLLNLYSLMFSFIYKITGKDESLQHLKDLFHNVTERKKALQQIVAKFKQNNLKSITTTIANTIDATTTDISLFADNLTNTLSTLWPTTDLPTTTPTTTTTTTLQSTTTSLDIYNSTYCYEVCSNPKYNGSRTLTTAFILLNLTTTMLPPTTTTTTTQIPIITTTTTTEPPTTTTTTTLATTTTTLPTTTTTPEPTTTTEMTTTTMEPTTTTLIIPNYDQNDPSRVNESDNYFQYYDYFDNLEENEKKSNPNDDLMDPRNKGRKKRQNNVGEFDYYLDKNDLTSTTTETITTLTTIYDINNNDTINTTLTPQFQSNVTRNNSVSDPNNNTMTTDYNFYDTITFNDLFDVEYNLNLTDLYYTTFSNLQINDNTTQTTATTIAAETYTTTMAINETKTDNYKEIENDEQQEFYSNENIFNNFTITPTITPDYDNRIDITTVNPSDENNLYMDYNDDLECDIKIICIPIEEYHNRSSSIDRFHNDTNKGSKKKKKYIIPGTYEYYDDQLKNVSKTLLMIRKNLTSMCWETSLGQELVKVIVFDAIMSIAAPLCIDFLRALFVRYVNDHWCWDMEKTFPQYGDFKIAESILNLVYNQGQVWMGIFFSPGLVIINLIKLIILMYLRSWIVLTCNVPHEVVFKASKSNNFYLTLLLTMLFLCVLPVGYAIVWLRPSWHCGPFSKYKRISEFFTNTTRDALPHQLHKPLEYITSSSTVIPLLLLLILIIYYLVSLTGALREANQDLRTQLQKERMEERKKIFKVEDEKPAENAAASITARWRKVLDAASPVTPTPTSQPQPQNPEEAKVQARKELLSRIMKKALRKSSITSEDESIPPHYNEDDETDNEHHENLPHDEEHKKRSKSRFPGFGARRARKPSIIDIVALAKKDAANEGHPKNRFKINRNVVDAGTEAPINENDPDDNSRIVSERRKSLLRRQNKLGELGENGDAADSSFEVVNERGRKTEPNVFKFDVKQPKESKHPSKKPQQNTLLQAILAQARAQKAQEQQQQQGNTPQTQQPKQDKPLEKHHHKHNKSQQPEGQQQPKPQTTKTSGKNPFLQALLAKAREEKRLEAEQQQKQEQQQQGKLDKQDKLQSQQSTQQQKQQKSHPDIPQPAKTPTPTKSSSKNPLLQALLAKAREEKQLEAEQQQKQKEQESKPDNQSEKKLKTEELKSKPDKSPSLTKSQTDKTELDKKSENKTPKSSPKPSSKTATSTAPAAEKHHSTGLGAAVGTGGDKLAAMSKSGRKRIGSFLNLVKEAVNKKGDSGSDESQCNTPTSPLAPIPSNFTPTTTSASTTASTPSKDKTTNSKKHKSSERKSPPARQDSQTSIPVITISKTGSEECILECSDKDPVTK